MIKILWWKLNQWLNKIKKEYGDYKFQEELKIGKALQAMSEEKALHDFFVLYPSFSPKEREKIVKLRKEIRTNSKI